jgi:hypothetical protein
VEGFRVASKKARLSFFDGRLNFTPCIGPHTDPKSWDRSVAAPDRSPHLSSQGRAAASALEGEDSACAWNTHYSRVLPGRTATSSFYIASVVIADGWGGRLRVLLKSAMNFYGRSYLNKGWRRVCAIGYSPEGRALLEKRAMQLVFGANLMCRCISWIDRRFPS